MNQRAVLTGALCLFAIGLGVYVLTLRTERDTDGSAGSPAGRRDMESRCAVGRGRGQGTGGGEGHGGSCGGGTGRHDQGAHAGQGRTAAQAAGGNAE